jgi:DNA replication and repair protein RecF
MPLESLKISHLRNIEQAELSFTPGINLIAGPNASGKTSLLEGIALLCQARSFRTSRIDQLVQHQHKCMTIVGAMRVDHRLHTLGMARENRKTSMKLDGKYITRSTDLINLQALHVITPESHEILDQGPKMRRQYLDWGVFHVKPDYLASWQRYHRVLRQRNHVLRQAATQQAVQAWDKPLVIEANALNAQRLAYLELLSPALKEFSQQLLGLDVQFNYRPGWAQTSESFAEQLFKDLAQDRERGFTQSGPHRADISFKVDNLPVKEIFSRGQQKLLICAMYLAQVAKSPKPGILLMDDLPAELDRDKRDCLLRAAATTGAQLFITATEESLIALHHWDKKKVFHVERGEFREVV